ncbi:MAG: polysaccharide deacetylase family protein [Muribaculaceae bacterium]|nr:polysaccharide deacetylase family protein [Muribaculaceae bacterium]
MWIEQPPVLYRMLFPEGIWRIVNRKRPKTVYLTFDDGPIPEVTPWVLDLLDRYGIKATFFCVGENVARYPELFAEIRKRGHSVGNHTYNHMQGIKCSAYNYVKNVLKADSLINSSLYRPPHGQMNLKQSRMLKKRFNIIMYDLVTRDYSKKLNGEQVLNNVKKYTRSGSIIVFHDSLKSERNLRYALPKAIEWLKDNGYHCETIPE